MEGLVALLFAIVLPGVDGRIDHLAFDAASGRVFVAALGNNTVEVIDSNARKHLFSLTGFREPQGISPVGPEVAVANGQGSGLQFIATADGKSLRTSRLGDDTDNVRYDAAAHIVYAGYGDGAIAAINPQNGQVRGQAKLAGHPESFQLEPSGSRIFVNVPSASQIAVIDRSSLQVTATWPVKEASANYPMALDAAGHRLFVGCRRPAKLLVFETESGRQVANVDIVGDTDDLFFDERSQRVFVIGGQGYLDVIDVRPGTTPARLERVPTAVGARTGLYVPAQNRIYVAVPHRGAQRAEVRAYQVNGGARPTVLFMCPHGAAKSVLASAYFIKAAKERGLNVRVLSAGTEPDPAVSVAVAKRITEQGLPVPIDKPRRVADEEFRNADVVISIGCDLKGLPEPRGLVQRWDEVPSPSENLDATDAAIRKRVQALIETLSRARDRK
jgi:protein-tyrosine-phosphatase